MGPRDRLLLGVDRCHGPRTLSKAAALRLRPNRPLARPASARSKRRAASSLGQPRPASTKWQRCSGWHTGDTWPCVSTQAAQAAARDSRGV
eukprot:scaffold24297_cov54-Phaeocystis_antarctica.AAC.1